MNVQFKGPFAIFYQNDCEALTACCLRRENVEDITRKYLKYKHHLETYSRNVERLQAFRKVLELNP